jgi:hypothetical protein
MIRIATTPGLYPPPGLKGHEIMIASDQFVRDNPEIAERPYGDAMAATLSGTPTRLPRP